MVVEFVVVVARSPPRALLGGLQVRWSLFVIIVKVFSSGAPASCCFIHTMAVKGEGLVDEQAILSRCKRQKEAKRAS